MALGAARDAGLPFVSYMLFGGPGETWEDVQDTQSFLNGCAPSNAVFASFGIRVYEGTPLAKTAKEEGVLTAGPGPVPAGLLSLTGNGGEDRSRTLTASRASARSGPRRRTGGGR